MKKNTLLIIATLFLLAVSASAQQLIEKRPDGTLVAKCTRPIPDPHNANLSIGYEVVPCVNKSDFVRPQPIDTSIWKARGPMTTIATGVCAAGQSADLISSTGREANGFLRGSNGRINMSKAVPLKLGLCFVPLAFDKKLPKWARVSFRIAQFFGGGVGIYDAITNHRNNHR